MKIKLKTKALSDLITPASRAVSPKSPLPIAHNIKLETVGGGFVTATGTDFERTVQTRTEVNVEEPGGVCIPARLLVDIVSKLPAGEVALSTESEGRCKITCGKSSFEVAALPTHEYPAMPTLDEVQEITLPAELLAEAVKLTAIAAASPGDEARSAMTGINLQADENSLTLTATDGRRLASHSSEIIGGDVVNAVIPSVALVELSKHLKNGDDVSVKIGRTQAAFTVGDVRIYSRLLEGRFPDARKVVPTDFSRTCRLSRVDLIAGLKQILITAQEKRSPGLVRLQFEDGSLTLKSNTPDLGSGEVTLATVYEGEAMMIGFNGKYLLDALAVLDCDEVQFDLQEETKSAVLRPSGTSHYDYVVMPIKLRDVVEEPVAA